MGIPKDFNGEGLANYYEEQLTNLPTGVSCIFNHFGYDDHEMRSNTIDHPDYGAKWRQDDLVFLAVKNVDRS